MNDFGKKADGCVGAILLIGVVPTFFIILIIVGIVRSCAGYGEVDIDNSYMVRRYEYDREYVKDSIGNGFEVLWFTTNDVTELRYKEIMSRKPLAESYKKFKREAADHFNHDFINTDIYDFVKYAKTFDIDSADVRLVNIWAYGGLADLYQRPHPNYPKGWRYSDGADLGVLYLEEFDVYPYNFLAPQRYRYWGCDATSLSDERYNHISDTDRRQSKN